MCLHNIGGEIHPTAADFSDALAAEHWKLGSQHVSLHGFEG